MLWGACALSLMGFGAAEPGLSVKQVVAEALHGMPKISYVSAHVTWGQVVDVF